MSLLTVSPSELQALATHCESWSAHVAVSSPPPAATASFQATAAAVGAVHVSTGVVGGVLATRMAANGDQLGATARELTDQDHSGAREVQSVVARLGYEE